MKISDNTVVEFHYRLSNEQGDLLDESYGAEPFSYVHGHGQIIVGLEDALGGMQVGDQFDLKIKPELAYGERSEELIQQVPKSAFEQIDMLQEGMQLQAQDEQGPVIVTVTKIEDDTVTLDSNHPLAGVTLHFVGEILSLKPLEEQSAT